MTTPDPSHRRSQRSAGPDAARRAGAGGRRAAASARRSPDALDKLVELAERRRPTRRRSSRPARRRTSRRVVMSVEKASLELQLAVQVRNKGVDAYQEIFRMQV